MSEDPDWFTESDEDFSARVARREGKIASVPREQDGIRKQFEMIGPVLNMLERAARTIKKMKSSNLSQLVPGVLDDLKGP